MIDRVFLWMGHLCTALMAYGLVASWVAPTARWATWPVYAGLVLLMLTPVTRVMVACTRYLRAGDRRSAALTAAILVVIALSGWIAR
jgi:uncharacterized membrane protein